MSEFLAEAQVVVRANTKLFIADFEKAVKKIEATKVTVTVRASMAGFRNDLVAKLKKSETGLVVRVRVTPDFTGFRAAVQAGATKAASGVAIPVGARAGAVTAGAVASGGIVDRRAATAQLAVNAAIDAGIAARRRLTGELSEEEKVAARVEREELHLKAAMDAVNKAAVSGVPALLERAQAEERAARAALAASRASEERRTLGVPVGVSTTDFKAQIAAQAALNKSRQRALEIDRAHAAALAENQRRIQAAGKLESAALRENEKRDQAAADLAAATAAKRIKSIQAETKALLARVAASPQALSAEKSASGIEESQAGIARAQRISAAAAKVEVDAKRKLTTANNVLRITSDSLVVAEEAYQAALASGSAAAIEAAAANLRLAEAEQIAAAAAAKQATAEALKADILTSGRRAIVAQIANLTGLRGAALTAASGFIAASAGVLALRKAVSLAGKLESELAVFNVTAGATADQMQEVREKAIALGADVTLPAVSAEDAAVALTELAKAGLSVEDSLAGAKGVLQLATAANIDFTQATQLTASALNAFGLAGDEASHVADVFANSANESQGSITDAAVAMQQASAVARQAGISFEQTAAVLTLFARAGLRGSDAGTSFRTAIIRLINPSQKAAKLIQELGLHLRTATGAINLDVFSEFADKTRDLTAAQRDQALAIIFGQDAIRGAAILARTSADSLNAEIAAVSKSGTAADVAAARTSGYQGAIENLKNTIATLAEEIGSSLLPAVTQSINLISDAIGGIEKFIGVLNKASDLTQKPIELVFKVVGLDQSKGEVDKGIKGFLERNLGLLDFSHPSNQIKALASDARDLGRSTQDARESLEDLTHISFLSSTKTIKQAHDEILSTVDDINKHKHNTITIDTDVRKLQALRDNLAGGDADAKALSRGLDQFIQQIQNKTNEPDFFLGSAKIKVPKEWGDLGKEASVAFQQQLDRDTKTLIASATFWDTVRAGLLPGAADTGSDLANALTDQFVLSINQGHSFADFKKAADRFQRDVKKSFKGVTRQGTNQLLGIDRRVTQAQIDDNVGAEVKAEQDRIKILQSEIAKINKLAAKSGKPIGDAMLKARTDAFNDINSAQQRIEALTTSQAQNVRQKQDDADQKILDALAGPTRKLDTRELIAQGTESLKDDIAVAKAQQQDNLHRIAVIDATFKNRKKAAEQIADLRDDNIKLSQQIAQDVQGVFDAEQQAFETKLTQAQDQGNLDKQIALTRARIATINKLIAAGKLEGKALQNYRDERIERKQQLHDLLSQELQSRVDLAQSVANLTGNVNPLINAINAQITETREDLVGLKKGTAKWRQVKTALNGFIQSRRDAIQQRFDVREAFAQSILDLTGNKNPLLRVLDSEIAAAVAFRNGLKKGTLAWQRAATEVNNLRKKRKDVLDDAAEGSKDVTSAFDLLKQANDTFTKEAGNLIGTGGQPFVGVTGFQSDIAKFLIQRNRVAPPTGGATDLTKPTTGKNLRVDLNDQPLIQAIERWIETINQQRGNRTTVSGGAGTRVGGASANPWAVARWFGSADAARNGQEG